MLSGGSGARSPAGTAGLSRRPAVRYAALAGVLCLGLFVHLHALSDLPWQDDELGYRNAGVAYLQGEFTLNTEHPFLVKYLFGLSQQVVGGAGPYAVRLVSALAAVLTALVVFAFGCHVRGWWTGVLAATFWTLLPHPVQLGVRAESVAPKVERLAALDPVMMLLLAAALLLAWRWLQDRTWQHAVAFGVLLGLAGSAKASAVYALPAIVLVALVTAARDRAWTATVRHGGLAAGVAVLVAVAVYAPDLPSLLDHLQSVRDTAAQQRAVGHAVLIADQRYDSAPWWALLYWQWAGQGWLVSGGLIVVCVLAPLRRALPQRLVALLLLSVLATWAALSFGNGFLLSHYSGIYQAPLAVLAALVVADLLTGRARLLGAVLALVLLVPSAWTTLDYVLALRPTGYAVLEDVQLAPGAKVAVQGNSFTVSGYFPAARVTAAPTAAEDYDAVVLDARYPENPRLRTVAADQRWRLVETADYLRVFVRTGTGSGGPGSL
ncbi:MAG: hypothetical protein JWM62_60 [Frankiales bacterium]|nr:hypothetical protein [Frankiales bacterium]